MDVAGPGIVRHLWFTFPTASYEFSRRTIIRIYWDDETEPSVVTPLGDFFCVPFGFTGTEYRVDNHLITVAPNNGFNCYFPMPFAHRMRLEVFLGIPPGPGGFYFQADYEHCLDGLPEEWADLRFHAQYRMENPTERYGHNYLALDAAGSGFLVGTSYGIRRRKKQPDEWYHGGGDTILIDGEVNPHILHGIGAEDYFGHSWGVAPFAGRYIGAPYFAHTAPGEPGYDVVLYRFHVPDPIRFTSSIRHVIGSMGDSISSVAYWYQTEPHTPYFTLPEGDDLLQEAEVRRGSLDIEPAYQDEWMVLGPIATRDAPFDEVLPWELADDPNVKRTYLAKGPHETTRLMDVSWQRLDAPRGFLDFHQAMRPELRTIQLQVGCYAYAVGYIDMPSATEATVRVAFDDRLRLRVNDNVVLDADHAHGFASQTVQVPLKQGTNRLVIKLSNRDNLTWRAWLFHLAVLGSDGRPLPGVRVRPRAVAT